MRNAAFAPATISIERNTFALSLADPKADPIGGSEHSQHLHVLTPDNHENHAGRLFPAVCLTFR